MAEPMAPAYYLHKRDGLPSFLHAFLRAPIAVGSPLPSSYWLAEILLQNVDWNAVQTFVEFGPGTGVFTRYALKHLPRTARLLAIDADPQFIEHLRETIADDRLCPITGSALDVRTFLRGLGIDQAEVILSGIPFSALNDAEARFLMRESAKLLGSRGLFCAYQIRSRILPFLREYFDVETHRREWRHFPPYRLYQARSRTMDAGRESR